MLNWFLVLFAVIITQALVLHLRFHQRAKGYMLRAAGWIWRVLIFVILAQTFIAGALVEVGTRFVPLNSLLLSILVGILTVCLSNSFEYFFLYRKGSEKSHAANALRRWRKAVSYEFGGAIRTRMEQDVYDWQTGESFDLTKQQMRRRIRQIYLCHATEIATKRGDSRFLRRDAGFSAEGNLYILAEHLGRKGLMGELARAPNLKWEGDEKRKRVGVITDRRIPGLDSRFYDNEVLIERIRQSQVSRRPELIEARIVLLVVFVFFVAAVAQVFRVQVRPVNFQGSEFSRFIRLALTIAGGIVSIVSIIWVFLIFLRGKAQEISSLEVTVVSAFMKALEESPLKPHTLDQEYREQPNP